MHPKLGSLDVGCGNGVFTNFLSNYAVNAQFYGIDLDKVFIEEANREFQDKTKNDFKFMVANGLELPFEDNTFDFVVSHAYLTSVRDPEKALREKIRVATKDGHVVSFTTQSFSSLIFKRGNYPERHSEVIQRLYELECKILNFYEIIKPTENFLNMHVAEDIPKIFGQSGLRQISMHPIGIAFSTSDAIISYEEKHRFISNYYSAEIEKLTNYIKMEDATNFISRQEIDEYLRLLKQHKKFMLQNIGENVIWEWFGGCNMMLIGQKPEY